MESRRPDGVTSTYLALRLSMALLVLLLLLAVTNQLRFTGTPGCFQLGIPRRPFLVGFVAVLIVEFAIFWAVQTWKLRNQPVRSGETVMWGIGHRTTIRAWTTGTD